MSRAGFLALVSLLFFLGGAGGDDHVVDGYRYGGMEMVARVHHAAT